MSRTLSITLIEYLRMQPILFQQLRDRKIKSIYSLFMQFQGSHLKTLYRHSQNT